MKRLCKALVIVLFAMTGTLALMLVNVDLAQSLSLQALTHDAFSALSGREIWAALLCIGLIVLYQGCVFKPFVWLRGDRLKLIVLSLLFAAAASLGAAYRADDGSMAAFPNQFHLLFLSLKAFGFFSLFLLSMKWLLLHLPKIAPISLPSVPSHRQAVHREFWIAWAILMLLWIPAFLAHFPGSLSADAGRVLQQYTGEIAWTSDHPPTYTLLLGSLVTLGAHIGGDAFGLFLYTAVQTLFLSFAMAYSISALHQEGVPSPVRHCLLALYAFLPMAMDNAVNIIKDIPYAAAFLLFCVLTTRALLHTEESRRSLRWWLGYGFLSLSILLLRHNGILVVFPTALVLFVRYLKLSTHRQRWLQTLLFLPVVLAMLFNSVLVPRFAYQPESTPDTLGITIQQTARILKNSPQDATATDLSVINRILQADILGASYSPKSSDPVRKLFRYFDDHTTADVVAYLGIWAKLCTIHPLTAFHAAWSLNGGFLDPFDTTNIAVGKMLDATSPKYPHAFNFVLPEGITALQERLLNLEAIYRSLPFVSWLQSVGWFIWLGFITWYLISRTSKKALRWTLLPLFMTLFACLLSAGFVSGSRYALPIVYTSPWLLCALLPTITAENVPFLQESTQSATQPRSVDPSTQSLL